MIIDIRNAAGLTLVLETGQNLLVEQSAGWLVDDELPGARSYPVSFPILPNEAFLGSAYRPDHARPRMELEVTVRLSGVLYRRCVLSYRIQDGKGSGYLKIDAGEVWSKLRKLSLQDALTTPVMLSRTATATSLSAVMKHHAGQKPGEFPCTFFPIRNEAFFETDSKVAGLKVQPYVNAWDGTNFVIDSGAVLGYPISPQFYVVWVLEQIFALAGYRMAGDWIADEEVQRLVILNQTGIDRPALFGFFSARIMPGQHLPNLSVGDFLKAIRQRYGLGFFFDGNRQTVIIRRFTDVLRSTAQDLSAYVAGDYGIEPAQDRGFRLVDAVDSDDELYRDSQGEPLPAPTVQIGGSASDVPEVKLGVSTTQLIYEPAPGANAGYWSVPTVRQPGNILDDAYTQSDRYPATPKPGQPLKLKHDIAFRILSYRGMVANSKGGLYPLATPDVRNGKQEVIGRSAATLTGRFGLWRQVLRLFYFFRDQTRPVTVPLDLPTVVFTGLKLHEPISLTLTNQARRSYLIDKLQADSPGPSGIMKCKLQCLTLPDGLDVPVDIDEPIVWLSMTHTGREIRVTGSAANVLDRRFVENVTVHVWANAQKTIPAVATNLAVTLRRKKTWTPGITGYTPEKAYEETLKTYYVSGQSAQIETDWVTGRAASILGGAPIEFFGTTFALDPGDDYNIIP